MNEQEQAIAEATRIGEEHGRNAGSWVELDDVRESELFELSDGTKDVWDVFYGYEAPSPLSGEYADGYSVDALVRDVGGPEDYSTEDGDYGAAQGLADAYEDGYYRALEAEILRKVNAERGPTLDLDEDTAYAVGAGTVAWRYIGQTFGGQAKLVMVGDDKVWTFDPEDVRTLDDNDYCAGCGQVGCTADGRDRS